MSRIGKLPITIPTGVTVDVKDRVITVTGPKGTLTFTHHERATVAITDGIITVTVRQPNNQNDRALWGLTRVLVANMIVGVTAGYEKKLEINGVGFKAQVNGDKLTLNLGFSHPIDFAIPAGLKITVEKNVVSISGIDKQLVGETAATIRAMKKPEPYKGKGIKYSDEVIRRKAGKVVKAAGAK